MSNSIIIRFKPKGDKELIASLKTLSRLQRQLEGELKKTTRASDILGTSFKRNQKGATDLGNAFSTARSKMLLFSFAMSLGGRQLLKFGKDAAIIEQMEIAFTNLSGGSENASIAIDRLREATNNTMSNFDLFQQANNAMVLGVTKNSEEMAKMFDMAQRLGKTLGVDTKRSIESFVTGVGRQSKLMLDNIGIMVKADQAYENYALKLEKSKDDLTDVEKKQAFLNATLEAGKKALEGVGEEQLTALNNLEQFSAASSNLAVRLGDFLLPALASAANLLAKLFDAFDERRIKSYATAIGALSVALAFYAAKKREAIMMTRAFKAALISTGIGAALVVLGEIVNALANKFGFFNTTQETTVSQAQRAAKALREQKKAMRGLQETLDDYVAGLALEMTLNKQKLEGDEEAVYVTGELLKLQQKGVKLGGESLTTMIEMLSTNFQLMKQVDEKTEKEQKAAKVASEINKHTIAQVGMLTSALANAALAGEHMGRAIETALKRIAAEFLANKLLFAILSPFVAGLQAPTLFSGLFGHQGGQVQGYATGGVVPPPGIPSYATGGGVDNVPAMLQEGEYVMRRSAVDSIGIENLNRMNRTGQVSGGVTVNFSGNVMSDDFVENEAIPKIKDAIRRGADIGIS